MALASTDFHIRPALAVSTPERRVHLVDPLEDRLLTTVDDPSGFLLPRPGSFVVEDLRLHVSLRGGGAVLLTEEGELLHAFGEKVSCVIPVEVVGLSHVVTGHTDGTIQLWDPASGTPLGTPHPVHDAPVAALCALPAPDGWPLIVSAGDSPGNSSLAVSQGLFHEVW